MSPLVAGIHLAVQERKEPRLTCTRGSPTQRPQPDSHHNCAPGCCATRTSKVAGEPSHWSQLSLCAPSRAHLLHHVSSPGSSRCSQGEGPRRKCRRLVSATQPRLTNHAASLPRRRKPCTASEVAEAVLVRRPLVFSVCRTQRCGGCVVRTGSGSRPRPSSLSRAAGQGARAPITAQLPPL